MPFLKLAGVDRVRLCFWRGCVLGGDSTRKLVGAVWMTRSAHRLAVFQCIMQRINLSSQLFLECEIACDLGPMRTSNWTTMARLVHINKPWRGVNRKSGLASCDSGGGSSISVVMHEFLI